MVSKYFGGVVVLGLLALSGNSRAADTFQVNASVGPKCILTIPQALDFGMYDAIGVNLTDPIRAQADIQVKYTNGTQNAIVYLGKGTSPNYPTCDVSTRELALVGSPGVDGPNYYIYKDPARTTFFGCAQGTADLGGVAVGPFTSTQPMTVTAYGYITANQATLWVGDYVDQVQVSVEF